MPDLLTHYALSYLVASRVRDNREALALAFVGVLPDLDALLRIHRSFTHSLVLTALAGAALLIAARKKRHTGAAALALLLYAIHIALDLLTAPTPVLWPLTDQAYVVTVAIDSTVTQAGVIVTPAISLEAAPADLAPQPAVEGPLVSPTGLVAATGVAVAIALERLCKSK